MDIDSQISVAEQRTIVRLQAIGARLYEGVLFHLTLNDNEIVLTASEAFDPTGGLPLLVARAQRAARLIHDEEFFQRAFPYKLQLSTERKSLTGLEVRIKQTADANRGMGLLLLDYAAELAMQGPGMAQLNDYLADVDDAAFEMVGEAVSAASGAGEHYSEQRGEDLHARRAMAPGSDHNRNVAADHDYPTDHRESTERPPSSR